VRKTKDAPKPIVDLGLPHGPPFIFVRELIACEPGVSAECATTFAGDDPMFAGHFPGNPLVPGVILTEAVGQTAGIAVAAAHAENARPQRKTTASSFHRFFQIIDRAPIAGSDWRNRLFPWPRAQGVIDPFLSSPKNVARTQMARSFPPVPRAFH
jgi:hypothetical protein